MKPKVKLPKWKFNVVKHRKNIVRWLKNHKVSITQKEINCF